MNADAEDRPTPDGSLWRDYGNAGPDVFWPSHRRRPAVPAQRDHERADRGPAKHEDDDGRAAEDRQDADDDGDADDDDADAGCRVTGATVPQRPA